MRGEFELFYTAVQVNIASFTYRNLGMKANGFALVHFSCWLYLICVFDSENRIILNIT